MHSPTEKTIAQVSRVTDLDEFARLFASVEFKQKVMKGLRPIPTNPATYAVRSVNELLKG